MPGVKNVAYISYNDPEDAIGQTAFAQSMKIAGLNDCYSALIPIGTMDFTTNVLAMKAAHCQAVLAPLIENSDIGLATSIHNAGANIKQFYETGYDQNFLDDSQAVTVGQGQYFEPGINLALNTPADKAFEAAIKKYDPIYKGGLPSQGVEFGWMAADQMILGLQLAGPNPTWASWIKKLATVKEYTVGGLRPTPTNLSERWKLTGPQCQYEVQLEGTKFVPAPPDGKPICGKVIG